MPTIYTPELSAKLLAAANSILLGNNGYADIGTDKEVADAMTEAGFVVIATRDPHGKPVFRGFTKAAQQALRLSPFGVSTYKSFAYKFDDIDYERRILIRDERMTMDY